MTMNEQEKKSDEAKIELKPLLLRSVDAAKVLAISDRSLWALKASGTVPCVRIGKSVRYRVSDLAAFVETLAP